MKAHVDGVMRVVLRAKRHSTAPTGTPSPKGTPAGAEEDNDTHDET
jgi:hypothetical protein